ncbi:MAG: peptidase M17, partial [Bacteroidia bacterium]|nr:peptidase M17 [Bacteroidia bacterium]
MKLFHENEGNPEGNRVFLVRRIEDLPIDPFLPSEKEYIREKIEDKRNLVVFYRLSYLEFVMVLPEKDDAEGLEAGRKLGDDLWGMLKNERNRNLTVIDVTAGEKMTLAVTEGLVLGSYTFANYKVKEKNEVKTIGEIRILSMLISAQAMERFQGLMKAVIKARDLVNEPVISLNTPALAESFRQMAAEAGMQAEVFGKKKIEALRMGGLLGVNKGSIDDPAFIILEWNPENAVNEKPVVIVGKGVVYDTGGMNIKTGSYMDDMKSDMAGAAAAGSAIYAAALARLPLHIIALIPATDNRVDGNAVVSGDVLTLYNGT